MHHHPSCRGSRVDAFGERTKPTACDFDAVEDVKQVLERARKPVELPDGHDITGAELVNHPVQLGTIPASATGRFLEYAFAPSSFERATLERRALIVAFRDTGVADQHLLSLSQTNVCVPDFSATQTVDVRANWHGSVSGKCHHGQAIATALPKGPRRTPIRRTADASPGRSLPPSPALGLCW
ncbi:hypothetical protein BSY17_4165 (plasmid) [Sphingobium sp. RAC03]|nr:hypothetical protein BSY17_4165 [Sphingobium sp. RAC03]